MDQDNQNLAFQLFSEVLLAYYKCITVMKKLGFWGMYGYSQVEVAVRNSQESNDPDSLEKSLHSIFFDGGGQVGQIVRDTFGALKRLVSSLDYSTTINPITRNQEFSNNIEKVQEIVFVADYAVELMNTYIDKFYNPFTEEMGVYQLTPLEFVRINNPKIRGPPESYVVTHKKKAQDNINFGVVLQIGKLIKHTC